MRHRAERKKKTLPCVLVDVNTQLDFLTTEGTCPVRNRERVIPKMRRVVAWAKRNQVPVMSTMDCHRCGELRSKKLPPHCVDGTLGQEKVDFTLFGSFVKVEGDNTLAVPIDLFNRHQQVIFRKRTSDFFLNPKADRFISHLPVAEYVMMGLGVEGSVKAIALGLIARDKPVTLVADACGYWDESEADLALRLMDAKCVKFITVDELVARRLARPIRYPLFSTGQVSLRNGLYASVSSMPIHANGFNGRLHGPPSGNGLPVNAHIPQGVNAHPSTGNGQ